MYLVLFYQVYNRGNRLIISEPMDFKSEDKFNEFCERNNVNVINKVQKLYRYKPQTEDEPYLYMKVVNINPFVSDDDLIAALEFAW